MNSHHNTTNESGSTLKKYESKAKTQEEKILLYFVQRKMMNQYKDGISPSQLWRALTSYQDNTPITSIRRALTNLTNQGKLEKTDRKVPGIYGRPEYLWKLKQN